MHLSKALLLTGGLSACSAMLAVPADLDVCNVVFTTPSADSSGAMPLGNGSLGVSAWIESSGDLVFYLNHTDTFSEASRLLKIGKVRVKISPSPLPPGAAFRQELKLRHGRLDCQLGSTSLSLFVENERPVVRAFGRFANPAHVQILDEGWLRTPLALNEASAAAALGARLDPLEMSASWSLEGAPSSWSSVVESADVPLSAAHASHAIGWYHHNASSPVPATLRHQGLDGLPGAFDPLLHRTFGAWLEGPGLVRDSAGTLVSEAPLKELDLRIACPVRIAPDPAAWIAEARSLAAGSSTARIAAERNTAAWSAFWQRSWVFVSGDRATPVPDNKHPVRIGIDSEGQNRFAGTFGRVALTARVLPPAEIARAAALDPKASLPADPARRLDLASPASGTVREEFTALDVTAGFTLGAWIRPDSLSAGRILDRMTAGQNDGFLFDTWPGSALRLIVGNKDVRAENLLTAGVWQHVAATYDPATSSLALYLNGRRVGGTDPAAPAPSLSQAYQLHRYTTACQTRGEFAPKFNGGIFTVEPRFQDAKLTQSADWRRWGDSYWFQNTRLIYHPMLMAGDADLMDSFWSLYARPRQLAEARSASWHQTAGSWIPETMTLFGTYANKDYGWNREGKAPGVVDSHWWRYAWNQTPELIDLLLKRYEWTLDTTFARTELLPQAESLLRYFDTRFRRDEHGLLVIDPTQSAETYWHGVVNDLPNIAGLRSILPRLRALPASLTTSEQRALFERLWLACPEIPVGDRETKDGIRRVLLPAHKFEDKINNCENPEQYAIWPFANYAAGKPDLLLGHTSYHVRKFHLPTGWGYDGNSAAVLGMTEEVVRIMKIRTANSHPAYRFPATWGPNFDWLPDNCHGGNLLTTTQLMLMQCEGRTIRLLPAWPPEWDVDFKLHAPANTIVSGTVKEGRLIRLDVTPANRRQDVLVQSPFALPKP